MMNVTENDNTSISSKDEALEQILGSPAIITYSRDGSEIYYYSDTQIKDAFELGRLPLKEQRKKSAAYNKIRLMDVGDTLHFPLSKHGAVRAAASKLKKEYDVQYITRKVAPEGEKAIKIVRLK